MGKIKLWLHARGPGRCGRDTTAPPTFYMNDWSELALRVNAVEPALDLLRRHKVGIVETPCGLALQFSSLDQIPQVVTLLKSEGLKAELSDRVVRVYQG